MRKFIFVLALILFSSTSAFAQTKGVSVSPSITHIDLATDPDYYLLNYENSTNGDITLNLSVEDFTQLEDNYKINFLQEKDAKNYKYSLSSWISFENKTIELLPKEKKSIKVFIDKNRITKGGHYASILATIVQNNQKDKINVKGILSSLLFVRASTGKELEEGKISSLKPLRDLIDYPDSYSLLFQNRGNVHVIPYGLLEIFDPLGNLVAKGIINEGSLDALPESIRRYDITTKTYQKVLLPGVYTARIKLHFGKTNTKLATSITFFSQGSLDFVKIGLFLIAIIALIFYYKKELLKPRLNNKKKRL